MHNVLGVKGFLIVTWCFILFIIGIHKHHENEPTKLIYANSNLITLSQLALIAILGKTSIGKNSKHMFFKFSDFSIS